MIKVMGTLELFYFERLLTVQLSENVNILFLLFSYRGILSCCNWLLVAGASFRLSLAEAGA